MILFLVSCSNNLEKIDNDSVYSHVYDLNFSPDWEHYVAIAITNENKYIVLFDWKQYWEEYDMIYSWYFSNDSSKYWFMWIQWENNRYLVENENKIKIEEWKTVDDYLDTSFYYWLSKYDYQSTCLSWWCRLFDTWYMFDIEVENRRRLYVNSKLKWDYYEIDHLSMLLKWDNYAFIWKEETWWKHNVYINWEIKYSFNWFDVENASKTYNYLTISDDWKSYALVLSWKIIKDWEELTGIEDYKDYENLEYTPWTHELNFLAYTTDWDYKKIIYKWWKIIWKEYSKIIDYDYSSDWSKLIIVAQESWKQFLCEYKD